ncbi:MAG: hypothetical protein KF729_26210 [Sandaracinaceae bacterium]|nr:hypothetical protein [Sandaracinaceae bacterium]
MKRAAWALIALGLTAAPASADVIDDRPREVCPPSDCPPGTSPVALSHSGCASACAPNLECASAADCAARYGEAARCEPTRFCVGTVYAGRGMSTDVLDACDPAGRCGRAPPDDDGDAPRCIEASRCIAPSPPASSSSSTEGASAPTSEQPARGGCAGCAASPRAASPLALGALLALGWLRRWG